MPVDAPDQPSVLLICTDHWSDIFTRPGGHPVVMTPTLDQLSRSGTRFTRAYSACPSCIPARKSLMTGMRARTHGDRVYRDLEWVKDGELVGLPDIEFKPGPIQQLQGQRGIRFY